MTVRVRRVCAALLALAAAGAPAACTGGSAGGSASPSVHTETVQLTRTPAPVRTFTPTPFAYVHTLPPGRSVPKGEADRACPYIRTGLNETSGGGVNVADIEGDRIYRTTVLTADKPVGCRFYFYAPPYEAVAEIRARTFPTAAEAHNALVLTARLGTEPLSAPNVRPGVDGISFRTKFFADDGARDWAFAFAKGRTLVVVRTQRSDTSRNAVYLGTAIIGKF